MTVETTETTTETTTDLAGIDLTDPRTYLDNDMTAVWREHRLREPVRWHRGADPAPGFWVVSRYDDTARVLRDNRRFGIEQGNMLSTLLAGGDSAGGRMVSVSDGSRHKDLRGLILKAFSPRALDYVADRVRTYASRLVADAVERGHGDFVADVAARIPLNTICDLLDVPEPDRDHLHGLNTRAVSSDRPGHTEQDARMARSEIVLYFSDLVQRRANRPGDDLISMLTGAEVDGKPLSSHDVVLNCYGLLVAGEETSRHSIIRMVHALASYPDQWAVLHGDDVDLDTATEEALRWSTPVMHIGRTATEDVEIAGQPIRAGEVVTVWGSSANRDETVFADPTTFDLRRWPNKHLTFGFGPHFCLGVFLARAEIRAVLECLRDQVAAVELAGQPKRIYSNVLDGFSRLPVYLTPS